ncbi:MAG: hypothetical protein ACI37S_01975 [Candidatus Gastranaerophilaceae bacterium]
METFYYNLSGGINQATTKTELGLDTKNIYWSDSKNIEILQNKGIVRQKGNLLLKKVPNNEKITALHELKYSNRYRLLITTISGKLYIYNNSTNNLEQLEKTLNSSKPVFMDFLNGTLVSSLQDEMFFIRNNDNYDIVDCNLKDSQNNPIYSNVISIYKGRVWVASGSTIYFSALGSYSDFQTSNDAGYINDFYTDTDEIIALKSYKDYLAIYKKNKVYLLTGSSPEDFAIEPFADKGVVSQNSIVNIDNKQYFFTNGIYTLQVGDLNQIVLGSEITEKIKNEFVNFEKSRLNEIFALNYEDKRQIWYFIPYQNDEYFHTIWINDFVNKAWYKRVLPQDITTACVFKNSILTADKEGNIYTEDVGNTFNGEPIEFMWKSPFLSLGDPTIRKSIDEFYFILDESYENKFQFSVYKNYDSENRDDVEEIYSTNFENLIWYKDDSRFYFNTNWSSDEDFAIWALDSETMYKAEISEANYSIQLCVEGTNTDNNVAIIGIEFKEIYNED